MTDYKYFSHTFPKICKKVKYCRLFLLLSVCVRWAACRGSGRITPRTPSWSSRCVCRAEPHHGGAAVWRSAVRPAVLHAGNAERGSVPASVLAVQTPAAAAAASAVHQRAGAQRVQTLLGVRDAYKHQHYWSTKAKLRIYTTIQTLLNGSSSFYLYSTFTIATRLTNVLYRRARLYNMHRKQTRKIEIQFKRLKNKMAISQKSTH